MSLRLRYSLNAAGAVVRDDARVMLDLLTLLRRERLTEDRPVGHACIRHADGTESHATELDLSSLIARVQSATEGGPRPVAIEVSGLHTAEQFPNPFWQYTIDSEVLDGWLSVRWAGGAAATRAFCMTFPQPEFLCDTPLFSPYRLIAVLKTVVGTTLTTDCSADEAS